MSSSEAHCTQWASVFLHSALGALSLLSLLEESLWARSGVAVLVGAGAIRAMASSPRNGFPRRYLVALVFAVTGIGAGALATLASALIFISGTVPRLVILGIAVVFGHLYGPIFAALSLVHWPVSPGTLLGPTLAVFGSLLFGSIANGRLRDVFVGAVTLGLAAVLIQMAASNGWLTSTGAFTNDAWRTLGALVIVAIASLALGGQPSEGPLGVKPRFMGWGVFAGLLLCATLALTMSTRPIELVVFDETHGDWETTLATYGPEDFGRDHSYTYSLLKSFAEQEKGAAEAYIGGELPEPGGSVFVMAMPTVAINDEFMAQLARWVRSGGRLLLIGDHTDLYNSGQVINSILLPMTGIEISATAVFDKYGKPNDLEHRTLDSFRAALKIGAPGFRYLTGASFSAIPLHAIPFAYYGMSFAEPGDYSRSNRFGDFRPRLTLPFGNHASGLVVQVDKGAVAVFADSTIWSNFVFHRAEYRHLFLQILSLLETPFLSGIQVASFVVLVFGLGLAWGRTNGLSVVVLVSGLALQLFVLAHWVTISHSALADVPDPKSSTGVLLGKDAKIEILSQLVPPNTNSYARLLSGLSRRGAEPISSWPGSGSVDLAQADKWLLIEPDSSQLPDPAALLVDLRNGASLTILFAQEQATDRYVVEWLRNLQIGIAEAVANGLVEDGASGIERRGPAMPWRALQPVTFATSYSQLAAIDRSLLLQTYSIRPSAIPRSPPEGLLTISFAAAQFSDRAIGTVWEGIRASELGRLREVQVARAIEGRRIPVNSSRIIQPGCTSGAVDSLRNFAVISDGMVIGKGLLSDTESAEPWPSLRRSPQEYLQHLRCTALVLVENECDELVNGDDCRTRLLGPDLMEWVVRVRRSGSKVVTIELLHERAFSGANATYNIIFSD